MHKQKINISGFLVAAVMGLSGAAFAHDREEMVRAAEYFDLITPDEARDIAFDLQPGYVSDIDFESRDDGQGFFYEIEIDKEDGSEWDIEIDAKTGEILHMKRDD